MTKTISDPLRSESRFGLPRNNSLNLLRLVLATLVLVHHCWPLALGAEEPRFGGDSLGGWAVAGFFAISGYLITGSRFSNNLGDYLIHRIARIMPAFWVCLILMAAVFAPIAFVKSNGTLEGYFRGDSSPLSFLVNNAWLKINQWGISGTPADVPYPGAWNGSLWSLYYEFLCYLVIAAVGIFGITRRSPWVITSLFLLSVLAQLNSELILSFINSNSDVFFMLKLLPFFLGGATLFVWREKIPFTWKLGVPSVLAALLLTWLVPGGQALSGIFVAYSLMWISTWLPQPGIIARNDISYGVYIYAFAFQQLLAVFGANEWGVLWFGLAALALTVPTAILSWCFVERPIMRAVKASQRSRNQPQPS